MVSKSTLCGSGKVMTPIIFKEKSKNILNCIPISSAEAERGFPAMDSICNEKRNKLTVTNISSFLTISLVGLPFKLWDPVPVVNKWLVRNHSADDTRVKSRPEHDYTENEKAIFKFFNVFIYLFISS
jgi:hypothetical protein